MANNGLVNRTGISGERAQRFAGVYLCPLPKSSSGPLTLSASVPFGGGVTITEIASTKIGPELSTAGGPLCR